MSLVPAGFEKQDLLQVFSSVASTGVPPAGAARLLDVGTSDYVSFFEEHVLDELVSGGAATCRFFQAPYGAGKTHLLQLLEEAALDRGYATATIELTKAVDFQHLRDLVQHVLAHLRVRREDGTVVESLPRILQTLGQEGQLDADELNGLRVTHVGFRNAMRTALRPLDPEQRFLLDQFLLGVPVTAASLKQVDLRGVKRPLTNRNAEIILRTLVKCLYCAGISGVMLLFDENQHVFNYRSQNAPMRVQRAANFVRRMIDACANGELVAFAAVFAVLPGFVETCAGAYTALGERLQPPPLLRQNPAWNWPILPLEHVNAENGPAEFASAAAGRLASLLSPFGANARQLRETLEKAGQDVLTRHAGIDYRRPLMKQYVSLCLEALP